MRATFGLVVALASATLASACGDSSSTSPTAQSSSSSVSSSPTTTAPPLSTAVRAAASDPVSDPGGEWNLTTPAGFPRGGCISLSDIPAGHLDWTVTTTPGHAHRILLQGIVTRQERPDCSQLNPGEQPRMLQITGGGWTIHAGDAGTRTITWSTEECVEDGGRFRIDVMVKRDVPSLGPADREMVELIVNCGFFKQR